MIDDLSDEMRAQGVGAPLAADGLSPSVEPVPVSPPDGASIPSAMLLAAVAACESAPAVREDGTLSSAANTLFRISPGAWYGAFSIYWDAGAYMDAALSMLPPRAEWRKYTTPSASIYAASPYNAKAQARYDGNASTTPLALTAANFRMRAAVLAKREAASAMSARQGQDPAEGLGAKPASAVGESRDAPTPSTPPTKV